jgi:hypothetical protein
MVADSRTGPELFQPTRKAVSFFCRNSATEPTKLVAQQFLQDMFFRRAKISLGIDFAFVGKRDDHISSSA